MRILRSEDISTFLAEKPVAVLQFDADWDAKLRDQVRQSMLDAEAALSADAAFAEIDCDANVELSQALPVGNIPLVAYYAQGKLVAALVGADQNVRARVERVLRGEKIGHKDGTTRSQSSMQATERPRTVTFIRWLLRGFGR